MLIINMKKEKFISIMRKICETSLNLTHVRSEDMYESIKRTQESIDQMKRGYSGETLSSLRSRRATISTNYKDDIYHYEIFRQASLYKTMAELHEGDLMPVDENTSQFIQLHNNI